METLSRPKRRSPAPRRAIAESIDSERVLVRLFGTVGPDTVRPARAAMSAALATRAHLVVLDLSGAEDVLEQGWSLIGAVGRQARRHGLTLLVVACEPLARALHARLGWTASRDLATALRRSSEVS